MIHNLFLIQDIGRWTDGWILYGIYGVVAIAVLAFVVYKVIQGKKRKARNKRIRHQDPKERTSD